jgi:hypothetical protein
MLRYATCLNRVDSITLDIDVWLDRTADAIGRSLTRLRKGKARLRKDVDEFARDNQLAQESRKLIERPPPLDGLYGVSAKGFR